MTALNLLSPCSPRFRVFSLIAWAGVALAGLSGLGGLNLFGRSDAAQPPAFGSNPGVPWPATDALGRKLPLADEVGPAKPGRFVGMFYFLWHNQRQPLPSHPSGPYDIGRILAEDPDAARKPGSALWGPIGTYHYWGEPLYGYYLSTDEWVVRRHAQLLADAGIDTLVFDATNAETYREVYEQIGRVFEQIRAEGGRPPQLAFMVNTKASETAERLYQELYRPGRFKELWFQWQGKPLLLCDPALAGPAVREFFTLRAAHWPFTLTNTPYAWHWEATYPQPYGYTEDPNLPEQVTVSVAQNLQQSDGKVTNMSAGNARGRSFHNGVEDRAPGAVNLGYNFEEQWQRAFALDPPFVLVTGWNEWIAGRWGKSGGPLIFVDQFDEEFSRDIEPVKGAHGDNYYWQLITNVRRLKGAVPLPEASPGRTIRITEGFAQWRDVQPEFTDAAGEVRPRDGAGSAGLHYTNETGRNDLRVMKVAQDSDNVFFYARTEQALTAPQGTNWMWLFLDIDQDHATGWEGYDYLINRTVEGSGRGSLEKNAGGWTWTKIGTVSFQVKGNELQMAIPRSALGLAPGPAPVSFDFKWADNLQRPGDVMDFYLSGDVAPEGRFNFRYQSRAR